MPCKQQLDILSVFQTHVFAKLHKQFEDWLRLKFHWSIDNKKDRTANCNDGSFQVLGTIGTLSFGKSCKCIDKS